MSDLSTAQLIVGKMTTSPQGHFSAPIQGGLGVGQRGFTSGPQQPLLVPFGLSSYEGKGDRLTLDLDVSGPLLQDLQRIDSELQKQVEGKWISFLKPSPHGTRLRCKVDRRYVRLWNKERQRLTGDPEALVPRGCSVVAAFKIDRLWKMGANAGATVQVCDLIVHEDTCPV